MKLKEFYEQLEAHDWFYEWSDDHSVWGRGKEDRDRLKEISKESREHGVLFTQWHDHMFSGESFECDKQPKPKEIV